MHVLALLVLLIAGCSQMKTTKMIDESQISATTKVKLEEARELIKADKPKLSILKLAELNDKNLTDVEKALKYNLKGVTLFNMGEIEKSILNFEVSEKYSPKDTQLFSQVQLNMASGHYKLNQFNELHQRLIKIDRKILTDVEVKKYAQLKLIHATKVQNDLDTVIASLLLMSDLKTFTEIQSSVLYEPLKSSFSKLSQSQKITLLEDFIDSKNLAVAQLAQIEATERYGAGDKSGVKDVLSWLRSEFGSHQEVDKYIKDFELRLDNSTRISMTDIGIVLPLSGEKASFGQKALLGVEASMKVLSLSENVKIHTKDSVDSPSAAAQGVLDLIREDKVSFIIGGLFPESAKAEYLEARKYGVLYISLSQINLPKEEKNHHLIEVQGSIESQVEALLSDDMIRKFGSRIGVVFPNNEAGKAYVEEMWRKANIKKLQITSIASFEKNTHDYRDTAQLFLGLKYPRERSEELKIVDDVYSLEKSSIRRVQTLPPVLDFDWVFLATFPHEATQLIPTLGYYDANRIKVIGGPSWVSKSMVKEQKNLGTLYLVGEDPKDMDQQTLNRFQEVYAKPTSLIELMALDAMKIGASALSVTGEVSSRDEFDAKLRTHGKLKGLSTEWSFLDGVWLKRMDALAITRGEIVKIFGTGATN